MATLRDIPRPYLAAALLLAIAVAGLAGFITLTNNYDAETRFVVRSAATEPLSLLEDADSPDLVFTERQVQRLNWASQNSVGHTPVADERLFCFSVSDGRVSLLRLVDDINVSERHRISGRCITQFGIGFAGDIHTHPGYNCELSDEDRSLRVDRQYRCVQCDEIVVGPTGDVGGLACWKVSETSDGCRFKEVEVGVK